MRPCRRCAAPLLPGAAAAPTINWQAGAREKGDRSVAERAPRAGVRRPPGARDVLGKGRCAHAGPSPLRQARQPLGGGCGGRSRGRRRGGLRPSGCRDAGTRTGGASFAPSPHSFWGRGGAGEGERPQAAGGFGRTDEGRANGRLRRSGKSGGEVASVGRARDGGLARSPAAAATAGGNGHSRRGWRPAEATVTAVAAASAGDGHDHSAAGRRPRSRAVVGQQRPRRDGAAATATATGLRGPRSSGGAALAERRPRLRGAAGDGGGWWTWPSD